ncbi:DUF3226 domain-containing protein [Sphaerotilus sp.]|uniref:DUF3226 domain-containing protein n=1 Tax=Sphaerotilus sp. TaxID=2093942 RepID=UPI002ACD4B59|nr:DUF3226 domain-containing protein [Sphaerotilus sp.]MDZ7857972.1 DUF3226 domain-containing protein [Sphaerotilus sp.]
MAPHSNILVVEGPSDEAFFKSLCHTLGLETTVKVAPPRTLQPRAYNTKQGVFNYLPTLLKQLDDGSLVRLGVVVDADSPPDGGFDRTQALATRTLTPFGYTLKTTQTAGLVYEHHDGLADVGVWVMPDNHAPGMLEDWAQQALHPQEHALFAHARSAVLALPEPRKFKPLQRSKAEVATWLAWQAQPGHGLDRAVEEGLFDTDNYSYQQLVAWLAQIFRS